MHYRVKSIILEPILCDYRDAYILIKGTATINGAGVEA